MALIECPECGREVSSSAVTCPECAYPLGSATPPPPPRGSGASPKRRWWKTALPLAARVAIGGIILAGGIGEESVAGVVGGALIGISVIPAWYRDKIERLKAGRAAALRDDHFEDRLAELEHRHREQLVQLERTHSGQIAELEERIDFAERLLTERREQIGPG